MFISLYTTRLILKTLGTTDFGIFNIVGGTIALLGFLNSSMASSSQRFMSYSQGKGEKEKQKNIFNVSFILHLGISAISVIAFIIAGFLFFGSILNIPESREYAAKVVYGSMIVSTAFSIMSVPYEAVMNAHEDMKYYAILGIFESFLKLVVAFATVYTLSDKLIVYGILMSVIPLVTLTIMRIYCHQKYEECIISPKKYFSVPLMKEITSFAGWGFINSISSIFTMQGMAIVLNMFGGVIVNTAHGIANQLSGQLLIFSNNMLKALNPVLVKDFGAGYTNKMVKTAATGNKLSFITYTIFAIPLLVECPFVLSIWLGEVPEYAVLFVRLVLIRQMVTQMMITLETCIFATGIIKKFTLSASVIWLSPLISSYVMYKLGAPIYTIYLLLIAAACCRVANALCFCNILCGLDVKQYMRHTLTPCITLAVIILCILVPIQQCLQESWSRIIVIILTTLLIYPILSYIIGFNSKERDIIGGVIRKLKTKLYK